MIETEQQRRWWFATHPEYSWSRTGQQASRRSGDEADDPDRLSPEAVDAGVDERLKEERDDFQIHLLNEIKFWFGTEYASKSAAGKHALLRGDDGRTETRNEPQTPEHLSKEAFTKELTDAGWSKEWAESRWKLLKQNESIARGVAQAMEVQGQIANVKAILSRARNALEFAARVVGEGQGARGRGRSSGRIREQPEIVDRFPMTPAMRKQVDIVEKELESAGLNRHDYRFTSFKDKFVARRDSTFDPHQRDKAGRTNIERMQDGYAPLDRNSEYVVLHHARQRNEGPMIEVTTREHNSVMRRYDPSRINRSESRDFRESYWQARARSFLRH